MVYGIGPRPSHDASCNHVSLRGLMLGFALGVLCTMGASSLIRPAEAKRPAAFDRDDFHQALADVLDRYVEPVDESRLLAQGLKHIVAELDTHSHFLTASERRELQKRSRGGAPGLDAVLRGHGQTAELEVVSVTPGSSAAGAGIQPGDFILRLGGRPVSTLPHQVEVEALLRGPLEEDLELTIQQRRERAPRTLRLSRDEERDHPPVTFSVVNAAVGRVAMLRIRSFRSGTGELIRRRLDDVRLTAGKAGLAGVVLDLRNNPGGEVEEALIVADLFIERGLLTRTRGRGGRILREEFAHVAGTDAETPLVVIQNRHSASASELLAAALQDHRRAVIVGERSFGKGTVQEITGLEDGSVLALTIARYFSPQDHVIDGTGVNPDVDLPVDGPEEAAQQAAIPFLQRDP